MSNSNDSSQQPGTSGAENDATEATAPSPPIAPDDQPPGEYDGPPEETPASEASEEVEVHSGVEDAYGPPVPLAIRQPKLISDRAIILLIGGVAMAGIACMVIIVIVLLAVRS